MNYIDRIPELEYLNGYVCLARDAGARVEQLEAYWKSGQVRPFFKITWQDTGEVEYLLYSPEWRREA